MKFNSVTAPNWVFSYVNDFLVVPIVATVALHAVWLLRKDRSIRLNIFSIFTVVLIFSIAFEYYLPKVIEYYVSDLWDVACYAAGGIIFLLLQKIEN